MENKSFSHKIQFYDSMSNHCFLEALKTEIYIFKQFIIKIFLQIIKSFNVNITLICNSSKTVFYLPMNKM